MTERTTTPDTSTPPPERPRGRPAGVARVLVVDDNQEVADSAVELLRVVGFEALACYDGRAALDAARAFPPDVCLIDLNMPGMEGDELAPLLRARAGGRPILFVAVTAMGDEASRRRTADAGFSLHLIKPVDPHDLLRVVDELWRVARGTAAGGEG